MPRLEAYHRDLPYSYAPGLYPCHALLSTRPGQARRLLVQTGSEGSEGVQSLIQKCAALGVRTETADRALERISRKENCHAALVFEKYSCTLDPSANHVVLHNPSDMGNLGTILRTCLGFSLCNLAIIRPAADVFDPRVVRASMGALFSVNVQQWDSFDAYRAAYPCHALYPFMLEASLPLAQARKQRAMPYALIFGNEATGLPTSFASAGTAVRIPHSDAIDSLNLAVAVSIAAYAFTQEDETGGPLLPCKRGGEK